MARKTLTDVLRENASNRSAAASGHWRLVQGGIEPLHPVAVDCHGSDHVTDVCYNRPEWVIEDIDGYYPTCLTHSGKVLNRLLEKHGKPDEVSLYFHPYKGA